MCSYPPIHLDRPLTVITCSYQDPFEEYKTRLAKKLAKRAEAAGQNPKPPNTQEKGKEDDLNWFGVKIGAKGTEVDGGGTGGVGKYLSLGKRPIAGSVPEVPREDGNKKRKIGFGDFEGW